MPNFMKKITAFFLAASTVIALSVHADDRLEAMIKMNSEGCVDVVKFEEDGPKDPKLAKPWCSCVYDIYFRGFTKDEQNQLFGGILPNGKLKDSLPVRLDQSKAQCRKKMGF